MLQLPESPTGLSSCLLEALEGPLELQLRDGSDQPALFRLHAAKSTIGSGKDCTIQLDLPGVQPVHCIVLRGRTETIVRRWSPQTWINGRTFRDAILQPGDVIRLGTAELEVLEDRRSWALPTSDDSTDLPFSTATDEDPAPPPTRWNSPQPLIDVAPRAVSAEPSPHLSQERSTQPRRLRRMFDRVLSAEARMSQLQVDLATGRHNAANLDHRLARLETLLETVQTQAPRKGDESRLQEIENAGQLLAENRTMLQKWNHQLDVREEELRRQTEQLNAQRERLQLEFDNRRAACDAREASLRQQTETLAQDQARFYQERQAWSETRQQSLLNAISAASQESPVDVSLVTDRLARWEEKLDRTAAELLRRQSDLEQRQAEVQLERQQWLLEKQELMRAAAERQLELSHTIHLRDDELSRVRQELQDRVHELERVRQESAQIQATLADTNQQRSNVTLAEQERANQQINDLQSRVSALTLELADAHRTAEVAASDVYSREAKLQEQIALLEQQIHSLEATRDTLQDQLQHAERLASQVHQSVNEQLQQIAQLQTELQAQQQTFDGERAQWVAERHQLESTRVEREMLDQLVQQAALDHEKSVREQLQRISQLQTELQTQQTTFENDRANWLAERAQLDATLAERDARDQLALQAAAKHEDSVRQQIETIDHLQSQLQSQQTIFETERANWLTEREQLDASIAERDARDQLALQAATDHEKSVRQQLEQIAQLQSQLQTQQTTFEAERTGWIAEREQLDTSIAERDARDQLALQAATDHEKSVRQQLEQIAQLQSQLQAQQTTFETERAGWIAEREQLDASLAERDARNQLAQQMIDDHERSVKKQLDQITQLQTELNAQQVAFEGERAQWLAEREQFDAALAEQKEVVPLDAPSRDEHDRLIAEHQQRITAIQDELQSQQAAFERERHLWNEALQQQLDAQQRQFDAEREEWIRDVSKGNFTGGPALDSPHQLTDFPPFEAISSSTEDFDANWESAPADVLQERLEEQSDDILDDISDNPSDEPQTDVTIDEDVEKTSFVSDFGSDWSATEAFNPASFAGPDKSPQSDSYDEPRPDVLRGPSVRPSGKQPDMSTQTMVFGELNGRDERDDLTLELGDPDESDERHSKTLLFGEVPASRNDREATELSDESDDNMSPNSDKADADDDPWGLLLAVSNGTKSPVAKVVEDHSMPLKKEKNDSDGLPAWFTDEEPVAERPLPVVTEPNYDALPADRPFVDDEEELAEPVKPRRSDDDDDDSAAFLDQLLRRSGLPRTEEDEDAELTGKIAADEREAESYDTLCLDDEPLKRPEPSIAAKSDARDVTATQPLPNPVAAPSKAKPALGGDEDSIEEYMNQLLARVGSTGSYSQPTSATTKPVAAAPPAPQPVAPLPIEDEQAKLQPHEFVPRSQAPEQNNSLQAMRELANQSARSAINRHQKTQSGLSVLARLTTSIVILLVGAIFMVLGIGTNRLLLIPGLGCIGTAIYLALRGGLSAVAIRKSRKTNPEEADVIDAQSATSQS